MRVRSMILILGTVSGSGAGAIIGGAVGGINAGVQFFVPDLYDNVKKATFSGIDAVDKVIDEHGGILDQVLTGGLRKAF